MPSFDILEGHARRIEDEMSASARVDGGPPKAKKCPICSTEAAIAAKFCDVCGHEFETRAARFKTCDQCEALNPVSAKECQDCGASFMQAFVLTLDEALRTGTIVRGMDVDETETQEGEQIADRIRRLVMTSGDAKLIGIFKGLPEESFGRVKRLFEDPD